MSEEKTSSKTVFLGIEKNLTQKSALANDRPQLDSDPIN